MGEKSPRFKFSVRSDPEILEKCKEIKSTTSRVWNSWELLIITDVYLIFIDTEELYPIQKTKDLGNIWIFATQTC